MNLRVEPRQFIIPFLKESEVSSKRLAEKRLSQCVYDVVPYIVFMELLSG